uniref:Putative secreted metalloprotease n=1 Tax=Ixodes ricinus TaxID=34613 RepID=A0A6B0V9A5_IXORI
MKVDSRILILASTIFAGVCGSDNESSDEFSDDSYWTKVCEKAHRHHMGITIIADKAFRNAQDQTGYDQRLYLETFVETVNLYFTELRCSNVKLFLIAVVNSTVEEESIFEIFKNTTRSSGKSLDPHLTLGMFREWATNQSFFNNSDVVYLLTGHQVFDFLLAYRLEMKAASYAFGVCSRWRVALSSDDGRTFSGVPAAVQQIANLLGVEWDDNRNKQGCTPQDGHVMSRNGEPTQYPTFSKCSKESWDDRTLMSLGGSPCYKLNVSTLMSTSKRRTPYTFFNCTEPCKNITKESENNVLNLPSEASQEPKTRNICEINCCPDYDKQLNARKTGAPDGMPCGPLQVCLQQVCVNVTEQRSEISTVPTDSDK